MRIVFFISIVLFCGTSLSGNAQEVLDFKTVDAKTYNYWEQAKWDSLILLGNKALENNVDYFYIRLRMGIAYYEKKDYMNAVPQFESANRFNSGDAGTLEYLYFSYLFSGREAEAFSLTKTFPEELLKKLKLSDKQIQLKSVSAEGGGIFSDNFSKNESLNFKGKEAKTTGAVLTGNTYFGQFGAKIQLSRKLSCYQGVTFLTQEKKSIFQSSEIKPDGRVYHTRDTMAWKPFPMPGYYTYDTIIENRQAFSSKAILKKNDFTLSQLEYSLNLNYLCNKGLIISPFVHLLRASYTQFFSSNQGKVFSASDTIETHTQFHYPPMQGGAIVDTVFAFDTTYNVQTSEYSFNQRDTSFINYSVGLSFNKKFKKIDASLFGSFSNFNGQKQKQIGLSLTYFPKGNLDLYFNVAATLFNQNKKSNVITEAVVGFKVAKVLWLESRAAFGDMENFTEKSGSWVYNNPDVVTFRAELTPIFVFKKFDIILRYSYYQKQALYYKISSTGNVVNLNTDYRAHLISGGIKWKF
jgi:hypothetical protein